MGSWFQGTILESTSPLTPIVLSDYPPAHADREVAASELGRVAPLGKINWYIKDSYPPDLCVCPSHLIVETDKVRVVYDWSSWRRLLDSVLVNPSVKYGTMDELRELLAPGALCVGCCPPPSDVIWM